MTAPRAPTLTVYPAYPAVRLRWVSGGDGGSPILRWQVRRRVFVAGSDWSDWSTIPGSGAETTTWAVTDVDPWVTYIWQVRAVNADGDGAASGLGVGSNAGWPTVADIFAAEIEIASAETVQRTQLEDGRVRQRLAWPGAPVRRTVRAYVRSDAERETVAAWAARAHAPFAAPAGITGAAAQVVVVGGAGGIRYRSVVMPGPRREWEIELVLEDAD